MILDFTGRPVFQKRFEASEWNEGLQVIPTERLLNAVYLLRLRQGNEVKTERLMIGR
jgi:hypothetical protein